MTLELTDKERIYALIISRLSTTMVLARDPRAWGSFEFEDGSGGHYVHFAKWVDDKDLKPGMLVMCNTSRSMEWKIAYLVECMGYGSWVIREVGGQRLCNMSNEMFTPIVGLSEEDLLEGAEYQFRVKVLQAFYKADTYLHCYGGISFKDGNALIRVRERWGGMGKPSFPYTISVPVNPKISIKRLVQALKDQGLETRSFDKPEEAHSPKTERS